MLRCTAAGLTPLMNSRRYAAEADTLFQANRPAFEAMVRHKSYYLFRTLPAKVAKALLDPIVSGLAAKQAQNGLWRGKDPEKTAYDIFSALAHAGIGYAAAGMVSPLAGLQDQRSEYALLLKRTLGAAEAPEDRRALEELTGQIASEQAADGSFGMTVTSTVIHLDRLLNLGMPQDDSVIQRGAGYLLAQRKPLLQGMHTSAPYGLTVSNVYTSESRHAEFEAALRYKPEWLPRHVCFHTMAMIPNAVCLSLLLRLGLEDDLGVSAALVSLHELYSRHGGFCATNIKKPYL